MLSTGRARLSRVPCFYPGFSGEKHADRTTRKGGTLSRSILSNLTPLAVPGASHSQRRGVSSASSGRLQ